MEKVLLHTPVGVRDIYGNECASKLYIENSINAVFNNYGYKNIQTPTFEFFEIFSKERGSVAAKDLYKFFDREGNTLVLRPDVTPSIARAVSKYYLDVNLPIKLCYNANTYINNSEYQGKLKEITQLGCELINDDSVEADAEIIAMVVDSLKATGMKEFLVEIGQVDFYKGLLQECGLDEETEAELRFRIENKNEFGVEELLEQQNVPKEILKAFKKLPELFGSVDVLAKAKEYTTNKTALKAIKRLVKLYKILEEYGVSEYISFDLGMLSNFNYYTGIIFKAYTYGTGNEIVAGGRYDKLLGQFGKNAPSVGFAVYMDQIMLSMGQDSQKADFGFEVVLFDGNARKDAIELVKEKRNAGIKSEMILKKKDVELKEYVDFKKSNGATKVVYVTKNEVKEV